MSFILRELVRFCALMVSVSMLTFALVGLSPVDPVRANVGQAALAAMSSEKRAELAEHWGADVPVAERFARWAAGAVRGDFGESLRYREPVVDVLVDRIGASAPLLIAAWVISGLVGCALGVVAGVCRGGAVDRVVSGTCHLLNATPQFWLAMLALLVFAVQLGWFPIGFALPIGVDAGSVTWVERVRHLVLPALTLGVAGVPAVALHTRGKTIEAVDSDYFRFALARGESQFCAVLRHGLRNLVLPALTVQLAGLGEVVGGSLLVEQVFSYPGIGQAAVTAGIGGDAPLLVGIAMATAAVVFFGNVGARVLSGIIDPRIDEGAWR